MAAVLWSRFLVRRPRYGNGPPKALSGVRMDCRWLPEVRDEVHRGVFRLGSRVRQGRTSVNALDRQQEPAKNGLDEL